MRIILGSPRKKKKQRFLLPWTARGGRRTRDRRKHSCETLSVCAEKARFPLAHFPARLGQLRTCVHPSPSETHSPGSLLRVCASPFLPDEPTLRNYFYVKSFVPTPPPKKVGPLSFLARLSQMTGREKFPPPPSFGSPVLTPAKDQEKDAIIKFGFGNRAFLGRRKKKWAQNVFSSVAKAKEKS